MNARFVATPATALPDDSSVQVVSLYKSHEKIQPRAVSGRFAHWRWAVVWLTQIVFYGLPWLTWHARPAVMFELASRRFYIFNLVLYPQDFIYLTALLLVAAYSLFLFTAVAGRLWCGYACPQTVYTEIFMWVERRIEGDRAARIKLDAAPWSAAKLGRKGAKLGAWSAIALWTGFSFVGYFTPIRSLAVSAAGFDLGAWETFWVLFYSLATFGNAGFMREQVCKYMCPYARFQSAMFDKDTLIISYDAQRGEPRGSRSKKADPVALGLGACVDCNLCVQVCPTGIDIRKGLQYECIGCAACVDVCDEVMGKMNYPKGLVRYDTQNGLAQGWSRDQLLRRVLRPRVLVYSAVLLLLCVGVATSLVLRSPFKADLVRDRATLARLVDEGFIENVYRLQVMNATEQQQSYGVAVDGLPGLALAEPVSLTLGPAEARWVTLALRLPPAQATATAAGAHEIHFTIQRQAGGGEAERSLREKSTFVVPR
jgi:cytochrome c oxidase accessory protein FixG